MLVLLTTVTAVEALRVLFSVAYHAGETLGNVPSGLVVVAILATPILVGPLRRVVPPPLLLGLAVGVTIICRVALQVVGDIGYPLAGAAAAFSLAALALAVVSARRHDPSGSTGVAVALTVGLFVDVVLRATGTSWDIVWRTDALAWGLTVALLVGLAAAAAVASAGGSGARRATTAAPA